MHQIFPNISEIQNVYLKYTSNHSELILTATLRYIDNEICYIDAPRTQVFEKPPIKTPAEITIYSTRGIYRANVYIIGSLFSIKDISFEVTVPKQWDIIQMRESKRANVSLPVTISYPDGYKISSDSYDIAVGGVSFYLNEQIPDIYKKLPCTVQLDFNECQIIGQGKYVKDDKGIKEYQGQFLYIFKFECSDKEIKSKFNNFIIRST